MNAMAMAEENGAKPPVVNAVDSGAGAGKGPVLGGHANRGRRWKKTRCFRLIAGSTDRGLKILRRYCLLQCQEGRLTAAVFMMLSQTENGSLTSKEPCRLE
jgi:hypothetical protein